MWANTLRSLRYGWVSLRYILRNIALYILIHALLITETTYWAPQNTPTHRLFVQKYIQLTTKENIKALLQWSFTLRYLRYGRVSLQLTEYCGILIHALLITRHIWAPQDTLTHRLFASLRWIYRHYTSTKTKTITGAVQHLKQLLNRIIHMLPLRSRAMGGAVIHRCTLNKCLLP